MAYQYKNYEESDAVKKYREQLEQASQQRPGEYQSQWQEKQQQAYDAVNNRKNFQYNPSSDPIYQQYRQQYQRQAKLGMQDTMGQAAAMNGGYGSSYSQMAGQQAYNNQMQQLNDRMPELYQLALEKYQMEGQQAMDRFNLASQMESQDYSRYMDALSNWKTERDYAANRYDNERSTDYNLWANNDEREYSRYQDQQQLARDQVDYLISIGAEVPESLIAASGYDKSYIDSINDKKAAAASYSGGGSSGGKMTAMQAALLAKQASAQGATSSQIKAALKSAGLSAAEAIKAISNSQKISLAGEGQQGTRKPR